MKSIDLPASASIDNIFDLIKGAAPSLPLCTVKSRIEASQTSLTTKSPTISHAFYKSSILASQCGVTFHVLLDKLFNKQRSTCLNNAALDNFSQQLKDNSAALKDMPANQVFIYSFSLFGPEMMKRTDDKVSYSSYPGHAFLVFCYKSGDEIRYRFLQSYVDKYSLQDYINNAQNGKMKNDFSENEFFDFIKNLQQFISPTHGWTKESSAFHQEYFHFGEEQLIDAEVFNGEFEVNIEYQSINLDEIANNVQSIAHVNFGNTHLIDIDQVKVDLDEMNPLPWRKKRELTNDQTICYFDPSLNQGPNKLVVIEGEKLVKYAVNENEKEEKNQSVSNQTSKFFKPKEQVTSDTPTLPGESPNPLKSSH